MVGPFSCPSAAIRVEVGTELKAGLGGPVSHVRPKFLCVVPVNGGAEADGHVKVFGSQVMKGVRDEPGIAYPCNVGVAVFKCDGHNWESLLGARVKHARTVLEEVRAAVSCAFRKNHDAHAFVEAVAHGFSGCGAAFFAFAIHPNRSDEGGAPSDDGPRFGFFARHENHGKTYRKEDAIHVRTMVAHEHSRLVRKLALP